MRVTKTNTDIQLALMGWAAWRKIGNKTISYPSASAFAREMPPTPGSWGAKPPVIDDDLAIIVDRAVSRLKLRCTKGDYRWEALTDCYLFNQTDHAIAERIRCDRRTIQSARKAAESWVDSHIISMMLDA